MVTPHSYRTEHTETQTTNQNYGEYFAIKSSKKIKIQPDLRKVLQYVDSNHLSFLDDLQEAIEIKSISGDIKYRDDLIKMVKFIEGWMVKMGAKYECFYVGYHNLGGKKVRLPPIILGTVKAPGTKKKTICVYGNIDIKNPNVVNWRTDPWKVDHNNKTIYGCGVAQGKGPLISWFHTIMAIKHQELQLPVNIKFIIESMYHQNSEGMKDFLMTQKQEFLSDIDYVVVCDSEWLGDKYPCVSYGCVGFIHYDVTVTKVEGSKSEPKDDLVRIFEKIAKGDKVLIPDLDKHVIQITPDEEQMFEKIHFHVEDVRHLLPPDWQNWDKIKLLMHYWRMPTIFVDDIEQCICEKKDFSKMKRKFVLKIVPRQTYDNCHEQVVDYIKSVAKDLDITNTVEVDLISSSRPWLEDCATVNYEAARRATIQIYKEDPSMIREDRDSTSINILEMIGKSILLLPLVQKGGNGPDNECILARNFYEGTKLIGAYLFQLAMLTK
ncbi:PREDICTED: cytosolic non-specific dipeptidase-like [Nicrophorus vespilloides]|uniref:Cytosolic non-specific dipeptidase-like n=1 Tax=Nicrophorus vespilloides TaxID=110193 RepID=A0ABM1N3X0_NICVS|nr:PREDICTED: cytosolic non-specific dipeptidase-like [Nicrophorus vespilloides]